MAFSDIGSQLAGRFTPRNLRCPMSFVIEIVAEFTPRPEEGCARIGGLRQIGMNNETFFALASSVALGPRRAASETPIPPSNIPAGTQQGVAPPSLIPNTYSRE
ncbi:hypothetical protein [Achromobacter kerstersii]|uniref:hypothetical protein n=1 Tax=Achromobacter kerstersii TaxID=1353890 RepID=UPI003209A6CA